MRLVIAEKRSVAFAIAQALGDVRQGDGYVSAGETLISWAQGHLVELSDPEEYTDMPWSARKWTMESLPIDPKSWRWRLSGAKGAVQRYRSLSELLRSDKVTELVNACDPDREGEAIFRRILMASKVSKPSLRMWAACATDRVHDTVKVDAALDERHADGSTERVALSASSDVTIDAGWTAIEHTSKTDGAEKKPMNRIPDSLGKGPLSQSGSPSLAEGVSAPPKPFTEATLLSAMEHASRFVADSDLKAALDDDTSHSGGIGTPATRAGILESLVRSGYLQRKGKQIRSTTAGRMLVGVAVDELKDVKLTAQWEQSLADIEHGRGDETSFLNEIRTACAAMPGRVMEMTQRDSLRQLAQQAGGRESFGPCPRCGKPVVKTGSVWQCSSNKSMKDDTGAWKLSEGCGYKIFAEKFGKKLTDSMVRRTLEGKRPKVSGLKSKAGKTFDARLVPDRQYGIGLSFDDLNRKRK